jgi:putative addiction module CopG family antidote
MNISLTPKLEEFVRDKVASGLYGNASELVREALRLLVARDTASAKSPQPATPVRADVLEKILALKKVLRERGIESISLFGSLVRNEAQAGSDIDLLIDVKAGSAFSLIDLVSLKDLLEQRLGHGVDVVMREGLDPAIRDRVLAEVERVF